MIIGATLIVLAALQGSAGDVDPAGEHSAQVLLEKLAAAYPTVSRWQVRAMAAPSSSTAERVVEVQRIGSRSSVLVEYAGAEGRLVRQLRWFAVQGFETVMTARRQIKRGVVLTLDDLVPAESEVLGKACDPVREGDSVANQQLRTTLAAGAALCRQALGPAPVVRPGDTVVVHYSNGPVSLVAAARVEQSGVVGDIVRVRNPGSGDAYRARVTGPKEVVVYD